MKLIQLNIWDGKLIRNAIRFLQKENADIINLQEVSCGGKLNYHYFNTLERLQDALRYKYSFFSPVAKAKFANHTVQFGMLILSKYPIAYEKSIYLQRNGSAEFSDFGRDILNDRVVQHVKIKVGGKIINDINCHGYFVWGTKMGTPVTMRHSKKMLKYIKKLNQDEKIIITGDFNLEPKSPSLKILSDEYPDLISRYKIKTTRNELVVIKEPIDNILVNDRVKVKSFRVPHVFIADHSPVIMNFD